MMIRRFGVIATASMLAVASEGSAQASRERDLFAFPGGQFRCRQTPVSARDSSEGVGIAMQFVEGDDILSQRLMDAGYSAAGAPIYLVVMANVPAPGRPFSTNGVVVRFGPNNRAAGLRIRPDTTRGSLGPTRTDSITAIARALEDLSDSENARARNLAARLWNRRCGSRPTSVRP